jgi:sec-independent protein translocase protein TatB
MFNIGGGELLVIVLIALIVLGPQRLPDAMRTVGRVVGEVRRISTGFQQELRDAFEDSEIADEATDDADDAEEQAVLAPAAFEPEPDDGAGRDTSVAPVIADALDAIVGPGRKPTSGEAPAAESGPELGDERAAS